MKNIKAIVFDLDDTLVSEYDYIKSGFQEVAKFLNRKHNISSDKVFNELIELLEKNSSYIFNRFLDLNSIKYNKEDIAELVSIYRNHKPDIDFFEDVGSALNKLRETGYKLGIITDGYKETQRKKIEVLNLQKYVDYIIITDELGREYWKPHRKSFEIMKEKLNVEFNEMVYIGDNPEKDFYIKNIFPITTVRIKRNNKNFNSMKGYFEDIREDYLVRNLVEFLTLIL